MASFLEAGHLGRQEGEENKVKVMWLSEVAATLAVKGCCL